jgi:predicted acyltransferase (DUF342 family)
LIFDNYLLSELKEKFRNQEIEVTLFLPIGTLLKMDQSMEHYDRTDDDYFLWNSDFNDAVYKVESDKIKCLICPNDEENVTIDTNTEEKDSVVTTTVSVNGEVVTTNINKKGSKKGLSINKDGVIIKTN